LQDERDELNALITYANNLATRLEQLNRQREILELARNSPSQDYSEETLLESLGQLQAAVARTATKLQDAKKEIDDFGNLEKVRVGAEKVYQDTKNIQQKSGKNKLYIGSQTFVALHAQGNNRKKLRTLNVNDWSWGLNLAWVEGGVASRAEFKLKLSGRGDYDDIPQRILEKFRMEPDMDYKKFLSLCEKEGENTLLYYSKQGSEDRPSWTAMEIAALLKRGYSFRFTPRKSNNRLEKISLVANA
ncbi:MAG TPA: hypothetical protein VIM59_08800, partial [Cellvibrio sp.]